MDRNRISNIEAVAAMPDLEVFADAIDQHKLFQRYTTTDPLSMVFFLAGQWAMGSANDLTSALHSTDLWELVRKSGARVGRKYPAHAPSYDKLYKLHRLAGLKSVELGYVLAEVFTPPAVALARSGGFYLQGLDRFSRYAHMTGDGSLFGSFSDLIRLPDGSVPGSRAKDVENARIAETYRGKNTPEGKPGALGVPIVVVGAHGDKRHERLILGVDLYKDRDELKAATALFEQVIELSAGGARTVNYDMLAVGQFRRQMMLQGVIPIVAMQAAAEDRPHIVVPYEERVRYDKGGKKPYEKGRVQIVFVERASHLVRGQVCIHDLWAVDGALMVVEPGRQPTWDGHRALGQEFTEKQYFDGLTQMWCTYDMPCERGRWEHTIDLTQERITGRGERLAPLAHYLSPVPEWDPRHKPLAGRRQDSESIFSWMKRLLPLDGRASKLKPEHFLADVVGVSLLGNAIFWDTCVAQHTRCAQGGRGRTKRA